MGFYDQNRETSDRDQLRSLQEEKLRGLLVEIDGNPFYREKLATADIDPKTIHTLDDLARLPFTHKTETSSSSFARSWTRRPVSRWTTASAASWW